MAVGEGSGLVQGYQGRGAATILAGGEQEPLAVLQRKKALDRADKDKQLASSQTATGQLTGAWDRDIPGLAEKRGAYVKLNSHFMQQNIDPRDPSNADAYSTNRDAYGRLKDKFTASGEHKQIYDKTREFLAKDRENKYDREESMASLEQWAALPIEERMGQAAPIPTLRPENFSVADLIADGAKSVGYKTSLRKPEVDPTTGGLMFVSEKRAREGWEKFAQSVYLDNYEKIIKEDPSLDGKKGYQKYLDKWKPLLEEEDKLQVRQKPQSPARIEKGQEEQLDINFLADRVAKIQVFDTETIQGLVNQAFAGNTVVDHYINSKTGEIQFLAFDEQDNLAPLVSMNTKDPSSSSKLVTFLLGGKITPKQQRRLAEANVSAYQKEDKTVEIEELALSISKGELAALKKIKDGGKFKQKDGDFFISEEIEDITFEKAGRLWGEAKVIFKLKNGDEKVILANDFDALKEIIENSGAITRSVLTKKGSGKKVIGWKGKVNK